MNKPLPVEQYIPQQTIQSYLDALLQEASSDLLLAEPMPSGTLEAAEAAEVEVPAVEFPPPAPVVSEKNRVAERMLERRSSPVPEVALVAAPEPALAEPVAETQPAWRAQEFEALLFDVGGLTLAVPLVSLGTIHALEAEITPLFGQPDWFLGILPTAGGNLKVLDTARWVMPERYSDALQEGLRFVISVQGHDWGLAVHDVSRSIKLRPDQVKWRSQQGKRPWLAGTVIDHMCALVDVSALAGMIATGQGQHEQRKGNPGGALA
ncbi:CheW domain-containing protein [Halopseudomonas sp.]|uniref:CheW domain-containing protein n=1 Tax=Halopseudomonas sp. TaxID=2901191 RepID=UPI0035613D52